MVRAGGELRDGAGGKRNKANSLGTRERERETERERVVERERVDKCNT